MNVRSIPFIRSEDDGIPVYLQLAKVIQEEIEKGLLAAGELIASERKIATDHHLSMATVRKALDVLVRRGYVQRIQGKGTFVTSTAQRLQKIRYYPLTADFFGEEPKTEVEFIGLRITKGDSSINQNLKIKAGQELYEVRRILTCAGKPYVYCVSYLPKKMFRNLEKFGKSDFENNYLYIFIENEYRIATIENVELYGAVTADDITAGLLHVDIGHPLLEVSMIALTHKKKPYEYRISYCLTDEKKIRRVI